MQIISAREFRSNQTKILLAAKNGQEIILTSRQGAFKLTPVTEEDSLTNRICRGLQEVKRIESGEIKGVTINELLNEL